MLFANAIVYVFTGAFDVTNCVSHVLNYVAVVLLLLYFIIPCELYLWVVYKLRLLDLF